MSVVEEMDIPGIPRLSMVVSALLSFLCLFISGCGSSSSGSLTFGTVLQGYNVRHERAAFGPNDTVAWVAQFASQADPGSITATILQADGPCPSGRALTSIQLPLADPEGKREAYQVPAMNFPVSGVPVPGSYFLRLSQGSTVLAQGSFGLTGAAAGTIVFGHGYSHLSTGGFVATNPVTRVTSRDQLAWVARFAEPADSRTVSVAFDRLVRCHATRVLRDDHVHLTTADATSFATRLPVTDLQTLGVTIPGTYVVSYMRGTHFLARGEITVVH